MSSPLSSPSLAGAPLATRPPGAQPTQNQVRRRAAALAKDRPLSTRAAGAGGSSSTMMRLYTADEAPGLRVDPMIILVLAIVFIFSVVSLHLLSKVLRWMSK